MTLPGAEKRVSPWMRPDLRQGDPKIAPVRPVRYPVPPKLSASFIAFGSDHRKTSKSHWVSIRTGVSVRAIRH